MILNNATRRIWRSLLASAIARRDLGHECADI
jgi:hypothetical protein